MSSQKEITLGSLFDGIAGFPLAASKYNIKTMWASEIEPFPIAVSKTHFPEMKHMGSITDIHLCTVFKYPEITKQYMNNDKDEYLEPVDVITFGSPCQELSVAGKRAGLGLVGGRSHLFFEAVRIIEQMQEETNGLYPKYAIWENVYGAFNSNGGRDFAAVLESLVGGSISLSKRQKWTNAGVAIGPKCQVAWRLFDAQYWGVAQRRRRIYLVADFTGQQRAGEILFIERGLSGDSPEGGKAREEIAACAGNGVEGASGTVAAFISGNTGDIGYSEKLSPTLKSDAGGNTVPGIVQPIASTGTEYLTGWDCQEKRIFTDRGVAPTLAGSDGGGGRTGVGFVAQLYDMTHAEEVMRPVAPGLSPTLNARMGTGGNQVPVMLDVVGSFQQSSMDSRGTGHAVACSQIAPTLPSGERGGGGLGTDFDCDGGLVKQGYAVRRLTPLECERLQGLPDNWTNIPGASDTARYKAIGNGLAIPCPEWILGRMVEVIRKGVKSLKGTEESLLNDQQLINQSPPSPAQPVGNSEK